MDDAAIETLCEALVDDFQRANLSDADRTMIDYAVQLTKRPQDVSAAHVDRLREQGFDDLAIHDICCVTSYFAFVNRIADGLGVELEID